MITHVEEDEITGNLIISGIAFGRSYIIDMEPKHQTIGGSEAEFEDHLKYMQDKAKEKKQ